jgi:hypothetical protein
MATRTLPAFLAPSSADTSNTIPLRATAAQLLRGALHFIVRSNRLRAEREIARVLRVRVEDLPALRRELTRSVPR